MVSYTSSTTAMSLKIHTKRVSKEDHLDAILHALSHQTRRALLQRLAAGPAMGGGTAKADCNVAGSGLQTSSSLGECATHLAHGGRTRAPMCGATRAAEGGGALAFGLPGLLDGAARGAGSFCGRSKT